MENPTFSTNEGKNEINEPNINIRPCFSPSTITASATTTSQKPQQQHANRKNTRGLSITYDPFKSYNQSQKIVAGGFINKEYLISAIGLLRILLLIFEISGMIGAICIKNTSQIFSNITCSDSQTCSLTDSVRISYIVFDVLGIFFSLLMFVSILFNLIYKGSLVRINWKIIFTVIDGVFAVALFIISIVCAVRASNPILESTKGALGAAAAFGFLSTIVYGAIIFFSFFFQRIQNES